ncbi:mitochondrial ribosomal protein MRP51 [Xylaria palmicola]|nr:mitochondrial ribosomal protein MRP51 [Xylaria palmicola]
MAARSVSPGAALLRSSRMFSVPNPIPLPSDHSGATNQRSATATAAFPTHLTITTPSTSRANGDWGLKRPLPLKTTTKQTFPLVRIRQMDTIEHVTDFQSASDHTMTLRKFQELNMPMSVPAATNSERELLNRHPRSVFEEEGDVTALDELEPDQAKSIENKRWKFKGPWLAGMTDGAFKEWLEKNVRAKRAEFRAYLTETYAKELTEKRSAQAIRDQLPEPPKLTAGEITEAQYLEHLRDIRADRLVLHRHITRFLDLAPLSESQYIASMAYGRPQPFGRGNPYATNGPPVTHPSAGLSYLRTPNYSDNHPIYGPQKYHPVVKARVLKPRSVAMGNHDPIIGVAGFIVDRPTDQRILGHQLQHSPRTAALSQLDLQNKGGAKLYYKVDSATVDSVGRIHINIADPGTPLCELVAKELLGEDGVKDELYKQAMGDNVTPRVPRNPGPTPFRRGSLIFGSSQSYGVLNANKV